jgi:hypothetical protein
MSPIKTLRSMLKDAMKTSSEFTLNATSSSKYNKTVQDMLDKDPLKVIGGDSFEETMKDILRSDSVCSFLLSQAQDLPLSMPNIIKERMKYDGTPATAQNIIINNVRAFGVPLLMFYWGMQVERARAAEEAKMLKGIELLTPVEEKQLKDELEADLKKHKLNKHSKNILPFGDEDIKKKEGEQI